MSQDLTPAQRDQAERARLFKEQRSKVYAEAAKKEDEFQKGRPDFCTTFVGGQIDILTGKGKTYGGYGN